MISRSFVLQVRKMEHQEAERTYPRLHTNERQSLGWSPGTKPVSLAFLLPTQLLWDGGSLRRKSQSMQSPEARAPPWPLLWSDHTPVEEQEALHLSSLTVHFGDRKRGL